MNDGGNTGMDTEEQNSPDRKGKKHRKHEKKNHKRKRTSTEDASPSKPPLKIRTGATGIADLETSQVEKEDDGELGKGPPLLGSPASIVVAQRAEVLRVYPFSIPVASSNAPVNGESASTIQQNSLPTTPPPQTPSSAPSLSKRTVHFHGSVDSSDDEKYSSPKERKLLANSPSPRHVSNPKALLLSPKKIANSQKRAEKKLELQDEREKLPIWTGFQPSLHANSSTGTSIEND